MIELLSMARGLKDSYSLSNKLKKMSVPTDHPVGENGIAGREKKSLLEEKSLCWEKNILCSQ